MIEDNDIFRMQVKENYQFSDWAGRTKEREIRISELPVPRDLVRILEIEQKEELPPSDRQQRIIRYVYSSPQGAEGERLVVTVFECKSVSDAHETLIDVVMTYMARNLPRCETKGLDIGDICFCGHGETNRSVIFARFNILVEIKAASTRSTSVDEVARNLDILILNQIRRTGE